MLRHHTRATVLLLLATSLAACDVDTDTFRPLQAGDPAPAYAARRLGAADTLRLAELHGYPLLLNVWATWCRPCREEMPALEQLHRLHADAGLHVIGVSVDSRGSEAAVRGFADEIGVTFTILLDPADAVSRQFRTAGVPETFLIDRDGRIAHRWIGRFDPLDEDARARVEQAVGG